MQIKLDAPFVPVDFTYGWYLGCMYLVSKTVNRLRRISVLLAVPERHEWLIDYDMCANSYCDSIITANCIFERRDGLYFARHIQIRNRGVCRSYVGERATWGGDTKNMAQTLMHTIGFRLSISGRRQASVSAELRAAASRRGRQSREQ